MPPGLATLPPATEALGLPLHPLTTAQALDRLAYLVERREPTYFVTANLNYAMLCDRDSRLMAHVRRADFIVADGMPLLWASRLRGRRLPERVAGSDLIWKIAERAAVERWRLYFLGGAPGSIERSAEILRQRYPGLQIVGTDCPPFRPLFPEEQAAQLEKIREARPDILFVAMGQPKADFWIEEHHREAGVSVTVEVGGTFELVSGTLKRAPRWMQKSGLEWVLPRFAGTPAAGEAVPGERAVPGWGKCCGTGRDRQPPSGQSG